nr:hypothetical protein [Biomaibacter acetigenes]
MIKTIATETYGIVELSENIEKVWNHMTQGDYLKIKRKNRIRQEIIDLLTETLIKKMMSRYSEKIDALVEKVLERQIDPYSAMEIIISDAK